ncbi:TetR family transcriptional regulator C-terminal domain-containing protein [Roseovarius sp. C7]|uniref:TetR family transcriptional regulator C-terminal domain-containing protein n=1 Tax=Roseovarius sp. C7 TaxID=3398643 RepID=UPI0039F67FB4
MLKGKDNTEGPSRGPASGRQPVKNRLLLIEATLDTIATHGITETTVSRIIDRAGLSRGMIHLHFGGKDNLLVAAAQAFNEAYYDEMERQVSGLGDDPTEIVMGVVRADLSAALLNERSAKIWHAFRGVASANPDIARFSDTRDYRLRQTLRQVFDRIVREEGREAEQTLARDATYGTLVMMEGMWTDFLTHMSGFDRGEAERIVRRFLKGLFPSSF